MSSPLFDPRFVMLDRVCLNFYDWKFEELSLKTFKAIAKRLEEYPLRRSGKGVYSRKMVFRSRLGLIGSGRFRYWKNSQSADLNFTVQFNPTRIFRKQLEKKYGVRFEKSLDKKVNFIPARIARTYSKHHLRDSTIHCMIEQIQEIIRSIQSQAQIDDRSNIVIGHPQISFKFVELYWSTEEKNALKFVEALKPVFDGFYNETHSRNYPTPNTKRSRNRDSLSLSGIPHVNETHKVYSKETQTVRWETELQSDKISDILKSRVIKDLSIRSVREKVIRLAEFSASTFQDISNSIDEDSTLEGNLSFVFEYVKAFKSVEDLYRFSSMLTVNGSISTDPTREYLLRKLVRKGIRTNPRRGKYRISEKHKDDLKELFSVLTK
ncbi:MAG: hypothetical protein IIB00_02770 [candidate division Zixibacteria bacterium]|nr:hypothetical protein [candidate division Zixibacteria bacterium]